LARPQGEAVVAGESKPGYCKVCAWAGVRPLNKLLNNGSTIPAALDYAKSQGLECARRTMASHKTHALTPENAVIQLAEQGRRAMTIRKTSNVGFLESLRDIGFSKAIDDPDRVSLDHALKAVSILEGRKDKTGDQINILVAISAGHRPPIVIEGEAVEVS
jgi:hypothetical protein